MAPSKEAIILYNYFKDKRRRINNRFRQNLLRRYRASCHRRAVEHFRKQAEIRKFFFVLLRLIMSDEKLIPKPRSIWSRPRIHVDFWEDRALRTYTEIEFQQTFRMSKLSFLKLCDIMRDRLEKKTTDMRKPLTVERKVALTLYKLATPREFRKIGNVFSVARNTACVVFHQVCQVINEVLKINFPNEAEIFDIINGFETELGIPQCCGILDTSHLPIIAPEDFSKDYLNRSGWHSVIMQALVDHKGRFLDTYIGWPGSVHNMSVFGNSSLCKKAEVGTLLPQRNQIIEGIEIPILIIGGPSYPLKTWLMKEFLESDTLTDAQFYFDYRLSHARMLVKNAFGRLKARWRCLLKRNDMKIMNFLPVIAACCCLHNFCETEDDVFNHEWLKLDEAEQEFTQPNDYPLQYTENEQDINIRNALVKHFYSQKVYLTNNELFISK